jgi:hypothetical protein
VPAEQRVHGAGLLHTPRKLGGAAAAAQLMVLQATRLHAIQQAAQKLVRILLSPTPKLPPDRAHVQHHLGRLQGPLSRRR